MFVQARDHMTLFSSRVFLNLLSASTEILSTFVECINSRWLSKTFV